MEDLEWQATWKNSMVCLNSDLSSILFVVYRTTVHIVSTLTTADQEWRITFREAMVC